MSRTQTITSENEHMVWSKPKNVENDQIPQLVRVIQSLFPINNKQQIVMKNRNKRIKDINLYLDKFKESISSCSPILTNYLKNFTAFFLPSDSELDSSVFLRPYYKDIELLGKIADQFPSFIPQHRSSLLMIFIQELILLSEMDDYHRNFEYEIFICDLYAKISTAGKWSASVSQNTTSTFAVHYQKQIESFCNTLYFITFKYELYRDPNIPDKLQDTHYNGGDSVAAIYVCSEEKLLKFTSENTCAKFTSYLFYILRTIISDKFVNVAFNPVGTIGKMTSILFKYLSTQNLDLCSGFLLNLLSELLLFLDAVVVRCGTLCYVFMYPLFDYLYWLLNKSSRCLHMISFPSSNTGVVPKVQKNVHLFITMLTYAVKLNAAAVRSVSCYYLKEILMNEVVGSLSLAVFKFVTFQVNSLSDAELVSHGSLHSSKKHGKKRKNPSSYQNTSKNAGELKDKIVTSNANSAAVISFLEAIIDYLSCCYQKCAHVLSAETVHKSVEKLVYVSLLVFSSPNVLLSVTTFAYPNMEYFQKYSTLKCVLLKCLQSIITKPNSKCSPPLSIIAKIFQIASQERDQTVSQQGWECLNCMEMVVKPNHVNPFPSIVIPYESRVETNERFCQSENEIETKNSSSQTIAAEKGDSFNVPITKIKARNVASQTSEKMDKIGIAFEQSMKIDEDVDNRNVLIDNTISDKLADYEATYDDEDDFVDICRCFVPDIVD